MQNHKVLKEPTKITITPELEAELWSNFEDAIEVLAQYNVTDIEINAIILSFFSKKKYVPLIVEPYEKGKNTFQGLNYMGAIIKLTPVDYDFHVEKGNRSYNFYQVRKRINDVYGNEGVSFYNNITDLRNQRGYINSKQQKTLFDKIALKINQFRLNGNKSLAKGFLSKRIETGLEMMKRLRFPSYIEIYEKVVKMGVVTEKDLGTEITNTFQEIKIIATIMGKEDEAEIKTKEIIDRYEQEVRENYQNPQAKLYTNPSYETSLKLMLNEVRSYYYELVKEKNIFDERNKPLEIIRTIKAESDKSKIIQRTINALREMAVFLSEEQKEELQQKLLDFEARISNNDDLDDRLDEFFSYYHKILIIYNAHLEQQRTTEGFNTLKKEADEISHNI